MRSRIGDERRLKFAATSFDTVSFADNTRITAEKTSGSLMTGCIVTNEVSYLKAGMRG